MSTHKTSHFVCRPREAPLKYHSPLVLPFRMSSQGFALLFHKKGDKLYRTMLDEELYKNWFPQRFGYMQLNKYYNTMTFIVYIPSFWLSDVFIGYLNSRPCFQRTIIYLFGLRDGTYLDVCTTNTLHVMAGPFMQYQYKDGSGGRNKQFWDATSMSMVRLTRNIH